MSPASPQDESHERSEPHHEPARVLRSRRLSPTSPWLVALVLAAACAAPAAEAWAQNSSGSSIGIGPRLTFVRSDTDSSDGSTRLTGAALRIGSGFTALELAVDYRSALTDDGAARVREIPFQGSVLIYPLRGVFAPYLLGGAGWYSQRIQTLDASQAVVDTTTTRRIGAHAGFGAEVRLHRRFSVYGDYRYTFIRLGDQDDDDPGDGEEVPLLDKLRPSHEGSMWTWGAVLRF